MSCTESDGVWRAGSGRGKKDSVPFQPLLRGVREVRGAVSLFPCPPTYDFSLPPLGDAGGGAAIELTGSVTCNVL